ncbi:MAG: DUF481 domain-containing protein [Paraglaciecola sp.]|uniref:DUF481 domain-containing protein n=1 Tax=Paraglaciecola sp. TaxID=1920173 RepID=UPI003297CCC6
MKSMYLTERPNLNEEELSVVSELGFLLINGNTNTSTTIAKLNISQELKAWSYQLVGDFLYTQSESKVDGKTKDVASAQKLFLSSQFDYKLTDPNNRLFVYGDFEKDRFNDYNYQAAIAAGWSSRLWNNEQSELRYSIGPGYSISDEIPDTITENQNGFIVRAAMEYKCKISPQATFRQFLSTEADAEYTKTKSESSLSARLSGALAMKLSIILNHDSGINDQDEELDTEAAVTLVYQFL